MSIFMKWFSNRTLERCCLLVIAVIMGLLFWKLFSVLQRDFAEVHTRMENGTMINLNDNRNYENMTTLLQRGMYFEDPKDVSFIASTVATARDTTVIMANVGELNKKDLFVNADEAFLKGGRSFKKRVMLSRNLLGFSGPDSISFEKERSKPLAVTAETNAGLGDHQISGMIKNKNGQPVPGALVRLKGLALQDSTTASESEDQKNIIQFKDGVRKIFVIDSAKNKQLVSFNAYARSDAAGKFIFLGLPANRSYEILPLQPGYEFGKSLGVENLMANANFNFVQSPHMMRLFSAKDFSSFKKEKAFIVRTPEEVTSWFWMIVAVFFFSFFLLHIILTIRFPAADQLLLPVIMILTGLSFITLFSLQDPLRDRFLAKSTFIYFCIGMGGMLLCQFINVRKFTTDSGLFRLFIFKDGRKAANGWPWALGAILLLILTILFGTGPEGSGVKVNLFGFQPSEIVKYMIIIFLAGFFATNEKFISEYTLWNKRLSFFMIAVIAIVATILLFLVLGDLGPAIVCCFTFIILFSFSRGDFPHVVAAMVLYALSIWIFNDVLIATAVAVGTLVLYMLISKKQLSESAVMALVVVSGFLLLDKIAWLSKIIPGPIQRLVDRKAIWADAWNNQVYGGDQVANGIWAISSGGLTGQGAGEGFAKTIPEAHTDMILPAIGEEFGWAGMACVFILFLVY
ncbi:MAG: FtsW/RodA/SpoVE family cell cycle protein, partial [Ferruginibacter sp.]